jgi:DNA-nicking Smr family endonuclease
MTRVVRVARIAPIDRATPRARYVSPMLWPQPSHTLDLHGMTVLEAASAAEAFLRAQRKARAGQVVRLITGRGRSGGGAPIRTRVRTLLRTLKEHGDVVRDFELEETEGSFLVRLGG